MSHNIFGERFYGNRKPGWHNIGTVFTDKPSPVEAVKKAGCAFNIIKSPLFGHLDTPMGIDALDTDRWGLFREPTPDDNRYRYLGHAAKDYDYLQNLDLARLIEPIADLWPVETVGALGKGETIFISLDAGDAEIKGDSIKQYFLITDTRDGGTSLKIAFTPVRVVCQNTLVSGLSSALVSTSLVHLPGVESQVKFRVHLLQKMQKALTETMATFEHLACASITTDDAYSIFKAAYPDLPRPKKAQLVDFEDDAEALGELYDEATEAQESWLYYSDRTQAFRDDAMTLFGKINDEYPRIAGTKWAAYNAVVELADYRPGSKTVAASSLFGSRSNEKKRAFAAALNV